MLVEPEPGAGCAKPLGANLTPADVLRYMDAGWAFVVGSGAYSQVCQLVKGEARVAVQRQRLAFLRDRGYVAWIGERGKPSCRIELTEKGRRRARAAPAGTPSA